MLQEANNHRLELFLSSCPNNQEGQLLVKLSCESKKKPLAELLRIITVKPNCVGP